MRPSVMILLMAFLAVLAGCDGEGLFFDTNMPSGDDIPGKGEGEGEPSEPASLNLGTWISAYGDDYVATNAGGGRQGYAAQVTLTRQDSNVTGRGVVYRVMNQGIVSTDKLNIQMSGTLSGSDLTAAVTSATGGSVSDAPTWRLRFSGNRMVGAYTSSSLSGAVVRSGHALWHLASAGDLNGTWITAFSDDVGTFSFPARSRTGAVLLEQGGGDATGTGGFVEQREADVAFEPVFDVTQAEIVRPEARFTFGNLDLMDNEMDWFSMFTSGTMVGTYAQYNVANALVRFGTAMWMYSPPAVTPSAFTGRWTAAFSDAGATASGGFADYIISLQLTAGEDNAVSGSGVYFQPAQSSEAYQTVRVDDAVVVGTRLTMDLVLVSTGETLKWDLRLANQGMMGSYQRRDVFGQYESHGHAQWRKESTTPSLVGTWVAAWYDTASTTNPRTTQYALVTVSTQGASGDLSGFGALRFMNGEQGRRLFDLVASSVMERDILWVWRGVDLFGDTTWRLRQAGDNLFGIYKNLNTVNAVESTGSAWWIRTSRSSTL